MNRKFLLKFAWLSIGASLLTMGIKFLAYFMTGSVGLLSDAIESIVNLVGGTTALLFLKMAQSPADKDHPYGHHKAEYFSSIFEGLLIFLAAGAIIWTSLDRLLFHPQELKQLESGLLISFLASITNLIVGLILIRKGRQYQSIALESDGHHLMSDVWTSVAVIIGLVLVILTGWTALDAIVAILMGLNILYTGIKIIKRSSSGLMDTSIEQEKLSKIELVMEKYRRKGASFHALKTRQAASRSFITVHFLVPGTWSVHEAHQLVEEFEGEIIEAIGDVIITTHLEPLEDEASLRDLHEK